MVSVLYSQGVQQLIRLNSVLHKGRNLPILFLFIPSELLVIFSKQLIWVSKNTEHMNMHITHACARDMNLASRLSHGVGGWPTCQQGSYTVACIAFSTGKLLSSPRVLEAHWISFFGATVFIIQNWYESPICDATTRNINSVDWIAQAHGLLDFCASTGQNTLQAKLFGHDIP